MTTDPIGGRPGGRNATYDIARGTAVILVVFMHVTLCMASYMPVPPAIAWLNWTLAAGRMPVVLLISGLLASGYLRRDGGAIARRAAHFVWLLIAWATMAVVTDSALGRRGIDPAELVRAILLPNSILWFIWGLALLTATIPLVRRMRPWMVFAVALAVGLLSRLPQLGLPADALTLKVANHALFFYIGLLQAERLNGFLATHAHAKIAALTAGLIVVHALDMACVSVVGWQVLGIPERLIVCLLALLLAGEIARTPLSRPAAWLGRNTLPIFVGQPLVLGPFLMLRIGGDFAVTAVLATAATVAGCLLIERCLLAMGASWMYRLPACTVPDWLAVGRPGERRLGRA